MEFPNNFSLIMDSFTPNGEVLIIAGDACNLKHFDKFRAFLGKYAKHFDYIIYIPGNHEYYGGSAEDIISGRKHQLGNCSFLNNQEIQIGKVRFICSTFWSKATNEAASAINDYYRIKGFTKDYGNQLHNESIKFVSDHVKQKKNGYVFVVTHHLPSWDCISKQYEASYVNSCFASNQNKFIKNNKIHFWAHGHSHDFKEQILHNTKIIRNPLGYLHLKENDHLNDYSFDL